jgi:hypothetical protein
MVDKINFDFHLHINVLIKSLRIILIHQDIFELFNQVKDHIFNKLYS